MTRMKIVQADGPQHRACAGPWRRGRFELASPSSRVPAGRDCAFVCRCASDRSVSRRSCHLHARPFSLCGCRAVPATAPPAVFVGSAEALWCHPCRPARADAFIAGPSSTAAPEAAMAGMAQDSSRSPCLVQISQLRRPSIALTGNRRHHRARMAWTAKVASFRAARRNGMGRSTRFKRRKASAAPCFPCMSEPADRRIGTLLHIEGRRRWTGAGPGVHRRRRRRSLRPLRRRARPRSRPPWPRPVRRCDRPCGRCPSCGSAAPPDRPSPTPPPRR
jgi:hypothetical protein